MPLVTAAVLLLGALGVGTVLIADSRTPPLPSASPPSPSAADPSLAMIAASLSQLAAASPPAFPREIVFVTPTPVPVTPRPTSSIPAGPGPCPDDPNTLPNGTICVGLLPQHTPTPVPTCQHPPEPTIRCEVRNSRLTTPTPTPVVGWPATLVGER